MKVGHSDLCPLPQFQWTRQSWAVTQCATKDTTDASVPCSRSQHACCLQGQHVYLLGGRDGYSPLKDFWRFDIECGKWENLVILDPKIPHLQGHTVVAFKSQIFIFGGTFDESPDDTPLWIYSPDLNHVRKYVCDPPLSHPMGRREHSAVVHKNCMYIYGGFMDSSGSTDELWAFNMEEEEWSLLPRPKPGKRHGHVSVVHHNAMWVHGGMKGLDRLADIWMYNFSMCTWKRLKGSGVCPALSYHTGHVIDNVIILVGGTCNSSPSSSVWLYGIENNTWRQVEVAQSHLFTSVYLHTSVLIDLEMNTKDKHCQSTPHLKSHLKNSVTPDVRPWTSPRANEGLDPSHMLSGSGYSEVNVLSLESTDTSTLDKNNNSEENIFSYLDSSFCHSGNNVEKGENDTEWHNMVDFTTEGRNCYKSDCELNEMTDVSNVQESKSTKIRPSSSEQCQDDLPLLERFQSINSDVDLGESNAIITISDEDICDKNVNDTFQEIEVDSFLYDNPAFVPIEYSDCHSGNVNVTPVQSSQNNLQFEAKKNNSLQTLHPKHTVDESCGFSRTHWEGDWFFDTLPQAKTISVSSKKEEEFTGDHLKLKTYQSFNDLILEDVESCDDESVLRDLTLASPMISSKCSSLKDVSSIGSSTPDMAHFFSHPFSINSPIKYFSKSCGSVDIIMNVKNKVYYGPLNKTNSLSHLLQLELKNIAKKSVRTLRTGKTGKYIKRQTISTHLNPVYLDSAKPSTNSNLQKKINLKKSIATQTGSQSSLVGKDSNTSSCEPSKEESHSKLCSAKINESNASNVPSGLSVFSDCRFVLLVLGGKTESASFIKTPLNMWKCKIF